MSMLPTGKELIDPQIVLAMAGLREGQRVADLGCGTIGHYVFPAAQIVGKAGKVYAVDIVKSALDSVESRMKMGGVTNIKTVWGDIERPRGIKIEDETVNAILVINNLVLAKEKVQIGLEAYRLLVAHGKLVVVDWKTMSTPFGPPSQDRVTKNDAKMFMQTAGFQFVSEFEAGEYHYGLVFEKT